MTTSGSLKISGTINGYSDGPANFSATVVVPGTSVNVRTSLACTVGFNAVTVPAGSSGVLIIPPAGNVVTITQKGVTGDTGTALHLTNPSLISLGASPSLGFTTSGSVTLQLDFF